MRGTVEGDRIHPGAEARTLERRAAGGDSAPELGARVGAFLQAEPGAARIARRLFLAGHHDAWKRTPTTAQRRDQLLAARRDLLLAVQRGDYPAALAHLRLVEQMLLPDCWPAAHTSPHTR